MPLVAREGLREVDPRVDQPLGREALVAAAVEGHERGEVAARRVAHDGGAPVRAEA